MLLLLIRHLFLLSFMVSQLLPNLCIVVLEMMYCGVFFGANLALFLSADV